MAKLGDLYITLDGSEVGDCTSGFMSQERMDAVLNNIKARNLPRQITNTSNVQVIVPGMNFTCNGTIQSWIFGAEWHEDSTNNSFPQLQIWRPIGSGSYTKVGKTTITTSQNNSQLYQYRPSSPLVFQTGDILGYYQPRVATSKLELYFENREGQLGYFYTVTNEHMEFVVRNSSMIPFQLVIAVVTG